MEKTLWIDTETTGLYSGRNAIVELAGIVDIDGSVEESFTIQFKPHEGADISPKALEINGRTEEEISQFPPLEIGIVKFKKILSKYVDKFNPQDKFIPAGYNIPFDLGFVRAAFSMSGDKFGIGSWCFTCPIDVWSSVGRAALKMGFRLKNYKLATVCKKFGISIDAHNPVSDIAATRSLFYQLEYQLSSYQFKDVSQEELTDAQEKRSVSCQRTA
jgi:DNA polymerase-3 subunit epsilon